MFALSQVKRKLFWIIGSLAIASLLIAACQPVMIDVTPSPTQPVETPPPPVDTPIPPLDTSTPTEPTLEPTPIPPGITPTPPDPQPTPTPIDEPALEPSVDVTGQDASDGVVVIPEVVSEGPGWIVIHADDDGAPGPVIGFASVSDGINQNVEVDIDLVEATETLHAMLHIDEGVVGEFEFPGPDGPAQVQGQVVNEPFQVTGLPVMEEAPETVDVDIIDDIFQLTELTVPVGTTVVWTHFGSNPHTVTADDGSFDSGTLSHGSTFEFTFNQPGTYPYHCVFHGGPGFGMAGTIIVTD
jgi:plastocyanin